VAAGLPAKGIGGAVVRHRPHLGPKGKEKLRMNRKGNIGGGNPKKKSRRSPAGGRRSPAGASEAPEQQSAKPDSKQSIKWIPATTFVAILACLLMLAAVLFRKFGVS
jgi:hypothetical protein